MATLTFDEAEIFSIMAEAKVPKAHATAMVKAFRRVHVDNGELATKADLTHQIELIRRDTTIAIQRAKMESVIQTTALVTGIVGVMLVIHGYFLLTLG